MTDPSLGSSESPPIDGLDVPTVTWLTCWRCGLTTMSADRCTSCGARPRGTKHSKASRAGASAVLQLVVAYSITLVASLLFGIAIRFGAEKNDDVHRAGIVALEMFDGLLTIGMLFVVGRLEWKKPLASWRWIAFFVSLPLFIVLLCINVAYFHALREYFRFDWLPKPEPTPWSYFTFATMILQPAIIEELFFRHLALGVLLRHTGVHAAVFVSSVMFAMAHVYNPLGLPYLFVCGLFLGYVRVGTGSLLLPMLFHGLHNAVVIYLEGLPGW